MIKTAIKKSALFGGLSDAYLSDLQKIVIKKAYQKGESIFMEGDDADGFYLIESGSVKIYKLSSDGKEKILHILNSGEPFGEVAMFTETNFPANADAIKKSTLLFIPKNKFIGLISAAPELALNMMAILSKRLKQFALQIEELSLKDVPGRLAGYLLVVYEETHFQTTINLNITKGQLASLLGTIPETLSRIMAKMGSLNLIDVQGKEIELRDLEGLRALSSTGRFLEN